MLQELLYNNQILPRQSQLSHLFHEICFSKRDLSDRSNEWSVCKPGSVVVRLDDLHVSADRFTFINIVLHTLTAPATFINTLLQIIPIEASTSPFDSRAPNVSI